MTSAEINAVIAEHDRIHGPPGRAAAEQHERVLAQERQQRHDREVRTIEHQVLTDAQWHSWFLRKLNHALLDALRVHRGRGSVSSRDSGRRRDNETRNALFR